MKLIVGNWCPFPADKGISVYDYNEKDGKISRISHFADDIAASYLGYGADRSVIYATHETDALKEDGFQNGIAALTVSDPENGFKILDRTSSLGPNPSWICCDDSGKSILIAHHGGFNAISTVRKNEFGIPVEVPVYDKAHLILMGLNEDGTFANAQDAYLPENGEDDMSRTHSVTKLHGDHLYAVCDKGLDMVFTVKTEDRQIIPKGKCSVLKGDAPRYGAAHPDRDIFYADMEGSTIIYAFRYDEEGNITIAQSLNILPSPMTDRVMPSDIIITPDGKQLYVGIRGDNLIAIIDLDESGHMTFRKHVYNEVGNPNKLCFSPDRRFLFVTNVFEQVITRFTVLPDGDLSYDGIAAEDNCPASLLFTN